jgi:hypothetical protein
MEDVFAKGERNRNSLSCQSGKAIKKKYVQFSFRLYFKHGQTSARAENLNGRIQRFIISNYGARDPDFFFYSTQVYFS